MPQVEEKENIEEGLKDMVLSVEKGNIHKNYFVQNNVEIKETVFAAIHQVTKQDETLQERQKTDKEIWEVIEKLEGKQSDKNLENYLLKNGVLKYKEYRDELIVVPVAEKTGLLLQYHDGALGGHLSTKKTLSRLKKNYLWK